MAYNNTALCEYVLYGLKYAVNCSKLSRLHLFPRYPSYTSSYLDLQSLRHPSSDKYSAITAYGTSKLCNLLFALQFHRNYVEHGVYCNAVHPGNLLPTNLTRDSSLMCKAAFVMARPFSKSVVSKDNVNIVSICEAGYLRLIVLLNSLWCGQKVPYHFDLCPPPYLHRRKFNSRKAPAVGMCAQYMLWPRYNNNRWVGGVVLMA